MTVINSERFGRAVSRAAEWHADQVRKGTSTPYLSHLLAVASLILEDGGDEDMAIAGLLHDAAEDAGGEARLQEIEAEFGPRVASMVRDCSDSLVEDSTQKAPWRERKEAALAQLAAASDDSLVVAAADKLHNLRSIVADHAEMGEDLWRKFNAGKEDSFWYYDSLHALLTGRLPASRSVRAMEPALKGLR